MRISDWSSDLCSSDLLSDYGWSKELAERHVKASGLDWTIVRPPAIYGPGDQEMLELFRMAKRGVMLMTPGGRLAVKIGRASCRGKVSEDGARAGVTGSVKTQNHKTKESRQRYT